MANADGQLVHSGNQGQGIHRQRIELLAYCKELAERLRDVRVCCGDWSRVCGPTPTVKLGLTGVFLDPPYGADADRRADIYAVDDLHIAAAVRDWCIQWQDDRRMRIALCGYAGEHDLPGWTEVPWKAPGGYGSQRDGRGRENARRERMWFSPHCLRRVQGSLFEAAN
jgi:hypothetical protein